MNKRDNRSDNTRRPDGQMEGNPEIDVQDSTINAGQEAQISDVEPMDGGDSDVSELEALKGLLDEKEKEVEKEKKEYLFLMAEFDNFRKRTEKEKSSMYIIGAKDIIEKILPVVDNFERGLAQATEGDPFAEGMEKIYKQLTTTLESLGVEPIEAVDKEFNPDLHNAVMHVEDESVGDNIIVEELQKGYTYKGFVVRHSMVKVAN